MSSSTVCHQFLEEFACAHVNDGFMDGDGERMVGCFMNLQGSSLVEVKKLKDKGNGLFRQNCFDRAANCYDEACKLLGLSYGVIGGEDIQSLCDLAVSLNSNLAACALKLEEYRGAVDLCTMILNTFPRNVKALFRRAVAFMKLKRFLEAEVDLVEALVVEPRNKDVLRELDVVKGHLLIKENGKRVLEVIPEVGVVGKSMKKTVHVSDSELSIKDQVAESDVNSKDSESVIMEAMEDQNVIKVKDKEGRVNMEVTDAHSNCGIDLKASLDKSYHNPNERVLEFTKKDGGNARLRIHGQSYRKLLEGKKLSFYNKTELSTITIRILSVEATIERGIPRCKKKKRKRGHKKRNSKTVAMNEDITSLNIMNVNSDFPSANSSASSTCAVSSDVSSVDDNFPPSGNQILHGTSSVVAHNSSLHASSVNDTPTSLSSQVPNDSNDLHSFIFSACPKQRKSSSFDKLSRASFTSKLCRYPFVHRGKEKRRITKTKKNYSQGGEFPRRNCSTLSISRSFSHKFLRPRGVSVSCCRYSSEAQLIKKRKEMSAHLASSNRPLKKPTLFSNPSLSLVSFSSNVIIKSDYESRASIV